MKQLLKWSVILLLAVLVIVLHNRERARKRLSWSAYGSGLLGLESQGTGGERSSLQTGAPRIRYLDKLRLLAVFLVILVHSARRAAELINFLSSFDAWRGIQLNLLLAGSALGLCCNLLFVMISGALLLQEKQESLLAFYARRVEKVVLPLAVYYLFYLRMSGRLSFRPSDLGAAAKLILTGPMELVPHFWLMYTLLGLYLAVPFFRPMLGHMSEPLKRGLLLVILTGSGVKLAAALAGISLGADSFLLSWEGVFLLGYLLTGEWMDGERGKAWRCFLYLGGAVGAAVIMGVAVAAPQLSGLTGGSSLLMMLTAAGLFLYGKQAGRTASGQAPAQAASGQPIAQAGPRRPNLVSALWTATRQIIGRYSFSILMIHWFFLFVIVEERLGFSALSLGVNLIVPAVLLQSVVTLGLSLLFSILLDQTLVFVLQQLWRRLTRG